MIIATFRFAVVYNSVNISMTYHFKEDEVFILNWYQNKKSHRRPLPKLIKVLYDNNR